MKIFRYAIRAMIARPFIVWFMGLLMLAYTLIESSVSNIVYASLFSFVEVYDISLLEAAVDLFEFAISFIVGNALIFKVFWFLPLIFVIAATATGLIFSGYFSIINNALERKQKLKGEFFLGVKKYFLRTTSISLSLIFFGFLILVFVTVAIIPAIVLTRQAFGTRPELMAAAIFIDLVTIGTVFFITMFFRVYMAFWYPAAFNFKNKAFSLGKRTVDEFFWPLVARFIAFDIYFIVFQLLFLYIQQLMYTQNNYSLPVKLVLFIGKWLFYTIFWSSFATLIFAAMKAISRPAGKK